MAPGKPCIATGWKGSSCTRTGIEWAGPQARETVAANTPQMALQGFTVSTRFVTTPPMADSNTRFGFVNFAETWNGRLAMMGFVIGLATELLTGQGILTQIGLG